MSELNKLMGDKLFSYVMAIFDVIDDSESLSLDNQSDREQLKSNIMDKLEVMTNESNDDE